MLLTDNWVNGTIQYAQMLIHKAHKANATMREPVESNIKMHFWEQN